MVGRNRGIPSRVWEKLPPLFPRNGGEAHPHVSGYLLYPPQHVLELIQTEVMETRWC